MPPKVVRGTIAKLAQHFGAVVGSTDATRPFKTFVVEVVDLKRHLVDAEFEGAVKQAPDTAFNFAYDLIVSDGAKKAKLVLAPALNAIAYRGELVSNCLLQVTAGKLWQHESAFPGEVLFVVTGVNVLQHREACTAAAAKAAWWPTAADSESRLVDLHRPAVGKRTSYIDDRSMAPPMDDAAWSVDRNSLIVPTDEVQPIINASIELQQLCSLFKDPRTKDAVIVATIVKKSQLIHLGRPLDSKDKPIPYNMYIELQDDSGHPPVVAVLWHNAAKKHFAALNLGDVISLTGFKKVIRATRYVTDWFCPGAEVELSVNSRNPTAVIKILRPAGTSTECSADLANFPNPHADSSLFVPRADHGALAVGDSLYYAGIVQRVGRPQRKRAGKDLWTYRWVWLIDPSSSKPCVMQMYECSQRKQFDQIAVGMVVICTHVEVCNYLKTSRQRLVYLTTSRQSQLTAWFPETSSAPSSRPFHLVPSVMELHDWALSSVATERLRTGACSLGFELFAARLFRAPDLMRAIPFATVQSVAKSLHLHERAQVVVQAKIQTLAYLTCYNGGTSFPESDDGAAGSAAEGAPETTWLKVSNGQALGSGKGVAARTVARTRHDSSSQDVDEQQPEKKGKGPASKRRRTDLASEEGGDWDIGAGLAGESAVEGGGGFDAAASMVLKTSREHFLPVGPVQESVCPNGVWVAGLVDINMQAAMEVLLPPPSDWAFKMEGGYARSALLERLPASANVGVGAATTDHAAILAAATSLFGRPVVVRLDICRVAWNAVEAVAVQVEDV